MSDLLLGVGIKHHSWKAGLQNSVHFVDCLVPICSLKHIFETMHGLFLSVQLSAHQMLCQVLLSHSVIPGIGVHFSLTQNSQHSGVTLTSSRMSVNNRNSSKTVFLHPG